MNMKRIYLQILEESDSEEQLHLNIKNRDYFKHYLFTVDDSYYTIEKQREMLNETKKLLEQGQKYLFGVFLKESNKLIGNVIITDVIRGSLQSCNLGYYLDQTYNGKGYGTEAVRLGLEYVFSDLKLHRIEAKVMPKNKGSIRILEKLGFQQEGLCRKNAFINGKWEDHFLYSLLAEEFYESTYYK
jgi:ribosomal-protein-alanine N-acetyltransferase